MSKQAPSAVPSEHHHARTSTSIRGQRWQLRQADFSLSLAHAHGPLPKPLAAVWRYAIFRERQATRLTSSLPGSSKAVHARRTQLEAINGLILSATSDCALQATLLDGSGLPRVRPVSRDHLRVLATVQGHWYTTYSNNGKPARNNRNEEPSKFTYNAVLHRLCLLVYAEDGASGDVGVNLSPQRILSPRPSQ